MLFIDSFLNKITMYRLVFYGLSIIAAISIILGFIGVISYSALSQIELLALVLLGTWGADIILSRIFHSLRNTESSWITTLILFFILAPIAFTSDIWFALAAGVIAAVSKYLFAIHKRHLFNPAAVAAFALSLAGSGTVIWWIATPILFPFALVLGLLVIRKIRRFDLFLSFLVAELLATLAYSLIMGLTLPEAFTQNILSWPTIFFGTIMLSEPFTTPPTRRKRIIYGAGVGLLFAVPFHLGPLYSTPEFALIIGNIFAYFVSSKQRLHLTLRSKQKLSEAVHEFVFAPDREARFAPGQYMEWTLPHAHADSRGNRRYFTIASAPGESDLRLGIRIGERSSSFKKALEALPVGATLSAAGISGGFTLPEDKGEKILAIAGGIGVTPFVSMMRHLINTGEKRDMILVYAANAEADFAYQNLIKEAAERGVRTILLSGKPVTPELLIDQIPDYRERTWYLSGPQGMVTTYRTLALSLGIHRTRIRTDYFPGL